MERETEGLVSLLSTLVVEELGHDLVPDGEEGAARCVGRGVLPVGASDALGERSWVGRQMSATRTGRWTGH